MDLAEVSQKHFNTSYVTVQHARWHYSNNGRWNFNTTYVTVQPPPKYKK